MTPFSQEAWACRCEWGAAAVLPYAWKDASAEGFARAQGAELAGKRRQAREALVSTLDQCGSGRELDGRGHANDKFIAGDLDVSACVPRFDGIAFVAT